MKQKFNMNLGKTVLAVYICILVTTSTQGQEKEGYKLGKGIHLVSADSFSLKFSARIQSLYQAEIINASSEFNDGFQIRRARLKFDGFAYTKKLQYKIELAIANSDINSGAIPESGNTANIVLDAYVKWNFAGKWSLWFGQTKLPGNRERVISSQALQFVDRSNVNARFNIDRDAGVQLHYNGNKVNLAGALSMGEGRNMVIQNKGGYGYTMRAEFLPFGKFTGKGDYFASDLVREPSPKLSVGITYDLNDRASRERGQLGDFMTAERDLSTWFADAHYKYNGFSSLIEYAHKSAPQGPVIRDVEGNFQDAFYTGEGFSGQAGYLFTSNLELAGRYTAVIPEHSTGRNKNVQYTFGVSKFFAEHSLKIQTDLTLIREDTKEDQLLYRLQLELGF